GADKGADRRFGEAERDDALLGDFIRPSGTRFLRPPHPAAFFLPSQTLRCRLLAHFGKCRNDRPESGMNTEADICRSHPRRAVRSRWPLGSLNRGDPSGTIELDREINREMVQ